MRIHISGVFVDDQREALRFYTEVLGFQVKRDVPVGEFSWLTVVSPEDPDGAELLATGEVFPNQAFRVGRRAFGLQFHPEATARMRGEWFEASAHMLSAPGAHPRRRQEADAERFDAPMEAWLKGLLDGHLLPDV